MAMDVDIVDNNPIQKQRQSRKNQNDTVARE